MEKSLTNINSPLHSQLKFVTVFLLFFLFQATKAQIESGESVRDLSTVIQVEIVEEERAKPKPHSPKRASTLSAIFPGLGQIYNRKYWKLPIVYGAVGGTVYSFLWNQNEFVKARDAYRIRINGTPEQQANIDPFYIPFSNDQIRANRDFYRSNRDLSVVLFLAVYLLNILDATVDAHLFYFNVNDDLDALVKPNVQMAGFAPSPGLCLTLKIK